MVVFHFREWEGRFFSVLIPEIINMKNVNGAQKRHEREIFFKDENSNV